MLFSHTFTKMVGRNIHVALIMLWSLSNDKEEYLPTYLSSGTLDKEGCCS